MQRKYPNLKSGFDIPGWKGPSYFLQHPWVLRPVWIIEMKPKDQYYSYGTQIIYVDTEFYNSYLKEIYDRSGTYWKTAYGPTVLSVTSKRDFVGVCGTPVFDDKTKHASINTLQDAMIELPEEELNSNFFTTGMMLQLSK
jgi:hypothetical protein